MDRAKVIRRVPDTDGSSDENALPPAHVHTQVVDPGDGEESQAVNVGQRNGFLQALRDFETLMDRKMKFEAQGIERILEDERKPPSILNVSVCDRTPNLR